MARGFGCEISTLLDEIQAHVDEGIELIVQSSSSLLHVPVSTEPEEQLDPIIKGGLAFADEKFTEIVILRKECGKVRNNFEGT